MKIFLTMLACGFTVIAMMRYEIAPGTITAGQAIGNALPSIVAALLAIAWRGRTTLSRRPHRARYSDPIERGTE